MKKQKDSSIMLAIFFEFFGNNQDNLFIYLYTNNQPYYLTIINNEMKQQASILCVLEDTIHYNKSK